MSEKCWQANDVLDDTDGTSVRSWLTKSKQKSKARATVTLDSKKRVRGTGSFHGLRDTKAKLPE